MPDIFEQISSILTRTLRQSGLPFGNLFHLDWVLYPALVFSSIGNPARNRVLLGIIGLLASQVTIFVVSALTLVSLIH